MPRGNGTGPAGQGAGAGQGQGSRSQGGDRGSWNGAGPGGQCVCPACGTKTAHQQGAPCFEVACPNCGQPMRRE